MFEGFAGVWTPIIPSRSLGKKPLAARLAGEPVVLFACAPTRCFE